jgi:hypothetical protein
VVNCGMEDPNPRFAVIFPLFNTNIKSPILTTKSAKY